MTREEMVKVNWKAYMSIEYKDEGMKLPVECLLSSVDFDAEILTLTPLDDFYEHREFPANLKYCSVSKRLKAAAIDGKKINDRSNNDLKAKKIGVYIKDDDNIDDAS